jgi:hypothetical protein
MSSNDQRVPTGNSQARPICPCCGKCHGVSESLPPYAVARLVRRPLRWKRVTHGPKEQWR